MQGVAQPRIKDEGGRMKAERGSLRCVAQLLVSGPLIILIFFECFLKICLFFRHGIDCLMTTYFKINYEIKFQSVLPDFVGRLRLKQQF